MSYQDGFRRARDLLVFYKNAAAIASTIISNKTNFAGIVGRSLSLAVDAAPTVFIPCDFRHGDFANANAPTGAEIIAVINSATRGIAGVTASVLADGRIQIVSDTTGTVSALVIGKGTANELFGWPMGMVVDASEDAVVIPVYTREDLPADISVWTYVAASQSLTRVVPLVTEVQDIDGGTITLVSINAIHAARIRF